MCWSALSAASYWFAPSSSAAAAGHAWPSVQAFVVWLWLAVTGTLSSFRAQSTYEKFAIRKSAKSSYRSPLCLLQSSQSLHPLAFFFRFVDSCGNICQHITAAAANTFFSLFCKCIPKILLYNKTSFDHSRIKAFMLSHYLASWFPLHNIAVTAKLSKYRRKSCDFKFCHFLLV